MGRLLAIALGYPISWCMPWLLGFPGLFRRQPVGVFGAVLLLGILLSALLAPWITPYDPIANGVGKAREGLNLTHWMGTDQLGRDVFSRVIAGTRISIAVGMLTVLLCIGAGTSLGLLAGYRGRRTDQLIMGLVDLNMAIPPLVAAMVIATVLGRELIMVAIAISWIYTPRVIRLVRSSVLSVKENEYVMAARAVGASNIRVAVLHVLPQTFAPIIVMATVILPDAIIVEASLSFLGMGVPPPSSSWGRMVAEGRNFLTLAPWVTFWPAAFLAVTVFSANMVGDMLRDVLDPRLRGTLG